ncbi:ABC transporter permease [Planomonospora alba]|uniref:ABC transporter permease n=1 Tax=Planomonospora alba TaxID=161354 RepID=A0ABP6N8Y9_9ACTN
MTEERDTTAEMRVEQVERVPSRFRFTWKHLLLALGALVLLLSFVRSVTGAVDLTSAGAVNAAIALAVPIGLAGLGGLWSERAGVVNIGLEGMLILGTWGGAWGAIQFGNPWAGVVIGALAGALGGLLHAAATVTFGVDHIISGVAITILSTGITQFLSKVTFAEMPGGGDSQSPPVPKPGVVSVPGVGDALASLEARQWFLVSDLAGIVRGLTVNVSLLTIVAVLLVPLTFYVLWRTAFGLRLRACGERPVAAESLGVNVYTYKYVAVVISGVLAGVGGAFLSLVASSAYREGQTGGRGFIGLAAMIFGNWRPGGLAAGSLLFGYTDALQLRRGGESVHALLLLVAVLLAGVAVYQLVKQSRTQAAVFTGAAAVIVLVLFTLTDSIPAQFTSVTPHITTLLVLSLAAQRLRPPAADGVPYRKGQAK